MVVGDGRIEKMFIEPEKPGDPFEVSDADTALAYLDPARSMGAVAMFARHGCPFCERAKTMLSERGIPFEAVYLGEGVTMSSVRAFAGAAKVPQIFIDGHLIGGGPTRCRCSWIRTLARRAKRGRRRAAGRRRRGSATGRVGRRRDRDTGSGSPGMGSASPSGPGPARDLGVPAPRSGLPFSLTVPKR
jgi:glutaredoxin